MTRFQIGCRKWPLSLILITGILFGCDPQRKRQCEWLLEPEPKHRAIVEPGWVSLCARNYENKKQVCFLQAPLAMAEEAFGKKLRYVDLVLDKSTHPKTIKAIKHCKI